MADHENCGCGHDCGCNHEEEETIITLTLDDDTEMDCAVISIFPAGGKEYIALIPVDSEDEEESEVFLYGYSETPEGEPNLRNIEDDEYEIAAERFDAMLDDGEI